MPTKFDFVSPGIQLREIDESQLPEAQEADGILLIGRARSGPAMKPVKVKNLNDFIDTFGRPIDGVRQDDPWREGNTAAPNYAAYAAQAYLAAGVGPVKYVRLLGLSKNATAGNEAGWTMGSNLSNTIASNAAAYGLFLTPSASAGTVDATLAAVFYVSGAAVALSGTVVGAAAAVSASALMASSGDNYGFNLAISSSGGETIHSINFNDTSAQYIRTVLNTDPTKFYNSANYQLTDVPYFLGETYDVNVSRLVSSSAGNVYGFIAGLDNSGTGLDDFQNELTAAKSGWFIGAQPTQKYLFRLIAMDDGEEFENNYYCRIKDIKLATSLQPSAAFTLEIVKRVSGGRDTVIEQYSNLSLDVNSANYISKRIGDEDQSWNETTQRMDITGKYPNVSNLVRVEVAADLNKSDVPFGFLGPAVLAAQTMIGGAATSLGWIHGGNTIALGNGAGELIEGWPASYTASVAFPTMKLTTTGTKANGTAAGGDYAYTDYFGLHHMKSNRRNHDNSIRDLARLRSAVDPHLSEGAAFSGASFTFTLDDIVSSSAGATSYYFSAGTYTGGTSISALSGLTGATGLIDGLKIKQFNAPFFGGFDGVDVRYADPFSTARIENGTDKYPAWSVEQALEMVRDQDQIRYELISMPGLLAEAPGETLLDIVTTRGDALAIMDIKGIARDTWDSEGAASAASINDITSNLDTRQIDSSYAATYFPNVRLRDTLSGNGTVLIAPPSVAAIGAIAKSENLTQPWFAPAGFNRGGLARLGGSSGPSVVGTSLHLTKDDRDVLYAANINPIARFPSTGDTVIFGQKTLQQTPSALDRINVRRLMIYLKRQIGIIADTILFDQNVQVTWNRFKSQANSVLSSVQAELGITEYKLVLDETTTTADLIDRNILYAKIFVKPARAIEFIAIDFVITRTSVEF
jgi:hypothetical protein